MLNAELPADRDIVAYCGGYFSVMPPRARLAAPPARPPAQVPPSDQWHGPRRRPDPISARTHRSWARASNPVDASGIKLIALPDFYLLLGCGRYKESPWEVRNLMPTGGWPAGTT